MQPLKFRRHPETNIPRLVYGTAWKKEQSSRLVYEAIEAGFRGIDTAAQPRHYNEAQVGEGIRRAIEEGIVKREEIYVSYLSRKNIMCLILVTDPNKIHTSIRPRS